MYTSNKVIWQDGMFIYPHHFQQQDIYYENVLSEYHLLRNSYGWGILDLEIDNSCLKLDKILINKCIGVFANGTLFNVSHNDSLICAIDIPKGYTNKLVYLGLPLGYLCNIEPGVRNIYSRYIASEHECIDTSSQSPEKKDIIVGKLNLSLLLEDSEDKNQFFLLPLFRVASVNDGIIFDKNYIPPCLRVKSSGILQGYINKILGLLNNYLSSKMSLIGEQTQQINQLQNLLILQIISKFKHIFELLLQDPNLTPHDLLKNIISLAASISVFSKDCSLNQIKVSYDHLNLYNSFNPLVTFVIETFEEINKSIALELDFEYADAGIYSLSMSNIPSLDNTEIVIGITFSKSDLDNERMSLGNSIKVASIADIKQVVALHVSGVELTLLSTLPYHIPYDNKTLYFKVNMDGRLWEIIIANKNIAIHINSKVTEIKNVKLWLTPQTNK
jgi:type VI secretion system protein ImpJ